MDEKRKIPIEVLFMLLGLKKSEEKDENGIYSIFRDGVKVGTYLPYDNDNKSIKRYDVKLNIDGYCMKKYNANDNNSESFEFVYHDQEEGYSFDDNFITISCGKIMALTISNRRVTKTIRFDNSLLSIDLKENLAGGKTRDITQRYASASSGMIGTPRFYSSITTKNSLFDYNNESVSVYSEGGRTKILRSRRVPKSKEINDEHNVPEYYDESVEDCTTKYCGAELCYLREFFDRFNEGISSFVYGLGVKLMRYFYGKNLCGIDLGPYSEYVKELITTKNETLTMPVDSYESLSPRSFGSEEKISTISRMVMENYDDISFEEIGREILSGETTEESKPAISAENSIENITASATDIPAISAESSIENAANILPDSKVSKKLGKKSELEKTLRSLIGTTAVETEYNCFAVKLNDEQGEKHLIVDLNDNAKVVLEQNGVIQLSLYISQNHMSYSYVNDIGDYYIETSIDYEKGRESRYEYQSRTFAKDKRVNGNNEIIESVLAEQNYPGCIQITTSNNLGDVFDSKEYPIRLASETINMPFDKYVMGCARVENSPYEQLKDKIRTQIPLGDKLIDYFLSYHSLERKNVFGLIKKRDIEKKGR